MTKKLLKSRYLIIGGVLFVLGVSALFLSEKKPNVENLAYYGFVRDEKSLRYALEHTKDVTPSGKAIVVDKNRTIDTNAEYRISEDMDTWQIADILLNRPSGHFTFDEYNYFF